MSAVESSIKAFEAKRLAERSRATILEPAKMQGLKPLLATCVQDFYGLIDGRRPIGWANNYQAISLGVYEIDDAPRNVLAEPSIFYAIEGMMNDKGRLPSDRVVEIDEATGRPALYGMRIDLVSVTDDVDLNSYSYELNGSPGSLLVARHELKYINQLSDKIKLGSATLAAFEDVEAFSQVVSEVCAVEAGIAG